jgi:DNA repair protein RadC
VAGSPHTRGHWARLRERFLNGGADALPDYELLEMVLYLGKTRGGDMKPLAKTLIKNFGSFGDVVSADPARLLEIDGVGEVTIAAIKTVQASAVRMARSAVLNRQVLNSSDALIDYCTAAMAYNKVEQFRVLFLDRKNTLIADEQQQEGTVDHTPVYPREVVRRALELGASAIIMVHNHPSGDPTPSRADIDMTRKISEAGQNVGVVLHDHIIIGRGMNASFKSMGLLE